MKSFQRHPAPEVLIKNHAKWTQQYQQKVIENPNKPSVVFDWPRVNGQRVSEQLIFILEQQTQFHCSYCDGGYRLRGTIDHFKPKSDTRFIQHAFDWNNLYVACKDCQDFKRSKYDDVLLRPDDPDFHFEKYFEYDFWRHEIHPQKLASLEDQHRAQITIDVLYLNHPKRCETRRAQCELSRNTMLNDKDFEIDICNYRFILELPEVSL